MRVSAEKVKDILRLPYSRILRPDEHGGFTAEILEFRGCFSEGETPEEAYRNLEEAAFGWIRAALEQGSEIPPPSAAGGYSGRVALRLPKSLHAQAAEIAAREGVSLNQFIVSAVATRVGSLQTIQQLQEISQKLDLIVQTQKAPPGPAVQPMMTVIFEPSWTPAEPVTIRYADVLVGAGSCLLDAKVSNEPGWGSYIKSAPSTRWFPFALQPMQEEVEGYGGWPK